MSSTIDQPTRASAHRAYLACALPAIAAYFFSPSGAWLQTAWFVAIGLSGSVAIGVGLRRHRPEHAAPWLWFAAGLALNVLGTLVEDFEAHVLHVESFPGVPDILYLGLYPAMAIGLALLIRRRAGQRDWATLVDSTTISTGLGLLSWVFLIHPAASDRTLGLLGHAVSVAYPIGDVLLLAMFVRLLLGGGTRQAAYWLMTGSLMLFLGGDAAWSVINQLGWEPGTAGQHLLQMPYLSAYALFGAAALHPSMRAIDEAGSARDPRLSPTLLAMLTAASLIAPGILAVQVARGRVTDGVAIVVGSVALFLLVVTRMAQLLRQVEGQAKQLRQLVLVDELTGLPNRRAWSAELPRAIERARRDGASLSIAMLDLDHFKRFNDEFGHPAGDRLLKGATAAWRDCLRDVDNLARYGGEEFILLLPGADAAHAARVLDRLQAVTPAGQSFSAGVASWDGSETSSELVDRADRALYEAKATGRDRVVVDEPASAAS
jgi:diguanylate cyclase (GGDEF)-like protein